MAQGSNVFAGKQGLITPRDLFRWADRQAGSYLELAQHGFMLLAERLRSTAEAATVQDTLQRILRVQVRCANACLSPRHLALLRD